MWFVFLIATYWNSLIEKTASVFEWCEVVSGAAPPTHPPAAWQSACLWRCCLPPGFVALSWFTVRAIFLLWGVFTIKDASSQNHFCKTNCRFLSKFDHKHLKLAFSSTTISSACHVVWFSWQRSWKLFLFLPIYKNILFYKSSSIWALGIKTASEAATRYQVPTHRPTSWTNRSETNNIHDKN